jgi:hypothetical protein
MMLEGKKMKEGKKNERQPFSQRPLAFCGKRGKALGLVGEPMGGEPVCGRGGRGVWCKQGIDWCGFLSTGSRGVSG